MTEEPSRKTLQELFSDCAPYYMSIGMTLDDYWNGDPSLVILFRKAEEHRQRREEHRLWKQGAYFKMAVVSALSDKAKYPDEPFPVTVQEQREREERDRKRQIEADKKAFMDMIAAFTAGKGGGQNGG